MRAELSDQELVEQFLAAIGQRKGNDVAARAKGITANDISRWRRAKWSWLSTDKRRALLTYLERVQDNGGADADADALSDDARTAYDFLTTTLRAQRGRHPDADPELIKDAIRGAIEEARARGWPLGPLYELLGRVESGDF